MAIQKLLIQYLSSKPFGIRHWFSHNAYPTLAKTLGNWQGWSLKHSGVPVAWQGIAAVLMYHLHFQMVFSEKAPASEKLISNPLPVKQT